jgi:peroxiredoxin
MDGVESHKKFHEELELPFDLLADVEKKAHEAYGFKAMNRSLFLVDKKGVVRYANRKFDLKKESWEELYQALEALE